MNKALLTALLSGVLLALAWPTYGISLLIFGGFVPLLLLERKIRTGNSNRRSLKIFAYSYLTFFTWNTITTWWIWYSTPFGMFFALIVNSLLMTAVFMVYHFVARKLPSKIHLVFLPAAWISFEKLHLNWDFSWPWLNLGNVFSESINWIQWYEYTGSFGGAIWIWMVNISIFLTLEAYRKEKNKRTLGLGLSRAAILIAIPVAISLYLYSSYEESEKKAEVVIVQPNVDPYTEKYQQRNTETAGELLTMVTPFIHRDTDYIIAPETMLSENSDIKTFTLSREHYILRNFLDKYPNTHLISGADFYRLYGRGKRPTPSANRTSDGRWYDVYNQAVQLSPDKTVQHYTKSKLVVGVEHFPFKSILEPLLGDIMIDLGGTTSSRATQEERSVFTSADNSMRAAPIICYESVYGEYVTDYVKNGANFLTILTNDAWWDHTQGHQQHLSYARIRAIETRRSIARSANTGISAIINEKGEILDSLAYDTKGVLTGEVTLNDKETVYTAFGDYPARVASLIAGFIFLFALARKKG